MSIMIESIEEGRKEDGNRSIADKILKRLHDLDKTVENNQGRWAWELLQNAKDSIAEFEDKTISVKIILNEDSVEFIHNGAHFTEQDVRGIINQITSKEIEEGQKTKKTGRFGTGFLSTHLLSRVINIKGILEAKDNKFYSFAFPLDRNGKTTSQLIPKIEIAWSEFHKSVKQIEYSHSPTLFTTSFLYCLNTTAQKEIAQKGVEEFLNLIPYVLAFIPKINTVEIVNNKTSDNIIFQNNQKLIDNTILPIIKTKNGVNSELLILIATDKKVSIAAEIEKINNSYSFKSNNSIPKLFCDFPLIGTESFYLPVIVNSFDFVPQTERDGIWLKDKKDAVDTEVNENQNLLKSAVVLFKELIAKISKENYSNFYNISENKTPLTNEKYFDDDWYKKEIQAPIREILFNARIVAVEDSNSEYKCLKDLWFPMKSYTKDDQIKIWKFAHDLYPEIVCKKEHLDYWNNLAWDEWNKLGYSSLVGGISKLTNIENLSSQLKKNDSITYTWLNEFCKFVCEDENNLSLFEKYPITPNRNGVFLKKSELFIDEIEDDILIQILYLLGDDWKNILLNKNIAFGTYFTKKKKDIADKISEKLRNPKNDENCVKAICLLSEWFENNNPDESKLLFSELYKNRAELFMNTITDKESLYIVMRSNTDLSQLSKIAKTLSENPSLAGNIQQAAELTALFNEFNVSSVEELRNILNNGSNNSHHIPKSEITQNVLVALGITSLEELEEALKDKDFSSRFYHISTPNVNMFLYAQSLINRAKINIISHIQSLNNYDCTEMEDLATTVIGGIKKDGVIINIVIRPSDFGEVIVYYSSEKDTLDEPNTELWIDNGIDKPKHLTLGKILKKTGINKIPV